jgi:hypothetical protein
MKSRSTFYAQVETLSFHTASVCGGRSDGRLQWHGRLMVSPSILDLSPIVEIVPPVPAVLR